VGARFAPGAPLSSDPKAEIRQVFVDAEARGGFLQVRIDPQTDPADSVTMTITLHGDRGMILHTATRTAR